MATVPKHRITVAEYLDLEQASEVRHEYLHGEIFAMGGASESHNLIVWNIGGELRSRLKQRPCRAYTSDMRVKVDRTGLYTYPDVVALCGDPQFEEGGRNTLLNPLLIVEVFSESTEAYDRGKKFAHYRQIESLRQYLLVSQDARLVELFTRQDDGRWVLAAFDRPEDIISLTSLDCELPLAEIYDKVELAVSPGRPAQNATHDG